MGAEGDVIEGAGGGGGWHTRGGARSQRFEDGQFCRTAGAGGTGVQHILFRGGSVCLCQTAFFFSLVRLFSRFGTRIRGRAWV